LNKWFGSQDHWAEDEIRRRGEHLRCSPLLYGRTWTPFEAGKAGAGVLARTRCLSATTVLMPRARQAVKPGTGVSASPPRTAPSAFGPQAAVFSRNGEDQSYPNEQSWLPHARLDTLIATGSRSTARPTLPAA
jgi:hypothetical protein